MFTPIATTPTKLGFDNAGIAVVKAAVNSVMIQGVENAHLLGDDPTSPSVTVPKSTDVSTADRNSRTLNNVIANGIIQGAIHRVNVQVNVAA